MKGGKAIVTSGFVKATLGRGVERFTSLRDRHRTVAVKDFMVECLRPGYDREILHGSREILIPVLENRNNATWIQQCKGIHEEESYTLLARDTYGRGEMITLCVPESFSDLKYLPVPMLSYMRREFRVNGVYLEGAPMISLFHYDNDSFILYPYLDRETHDTDIFLHVQDAKALTEVVSGKRIRCTPRRARLCSVFMPWWASSAAIMWNGKRSLDGKTERLYVRSNAAGMP